MPIIAGAAGYDLLRSLPLLMADDLTFFLAGSAAAFVSAVIAIRFFIKILGNYTLKAFAIYRLLLAIPVYFFLAG